MYCHLHPSSSNGLSRSFVNLRFPQTHWIVHYESRFHHVFLHRFSCYRYSSHRRPCRQISPQKKVRTPVQRILCSASTDLHHGRINQTVAESNSQTDVTTFPSETLHEAGTPTIENPVLEAPQHTSTPTIPTRSNTPPGFPDPSSFSPSTPPTTPTILPQEHRPYLQAHHHPNPSIQYISPTVSYIEYYIRFE